MKKQTLRRTAAGILAVLTVTGNMLAPAQFRIPFGAESTLVAEAYTLNSKGYAF